MFKRFNRHYFDLLWAMTHKEFSTRYKQATFGFLWILLNPLLQMVVVGSIFSFFVKIPNYWLFILSGLLPWQFFSLSVTKATSCFVTERFLLQKAAFPKEILPLSVVLSSFIHFAIAELLLLLLASVISTPSLAHIFLLIIAMVWLLVFTTGFSLLAGTLNVRYRDVSFLIQALLAVWFYATPIVYAASMLPEKLQTFLCINPLTIPFLLFQTIFTGQSLPVIPHMVISSLIAACAVGLSALAFRRLNDYFVDWL